MTYKISIEAGIDLEKIWAYTFKIWSIEQADRYMSLILEEIEYIASKPGYGKDISFIRKGYLRTKVKSHFIFYKIDKNKDVIYIIRILHERMDIKNSLK